MRKRTIAVYPGERVEVPGRSEKFYLHSSGDDVAVFASETGQRRVLRVGDVFELETGDMVVEGLEEPKTPIWTRIYWDVREWLGW